MRLRFDRTLHVDDLTDGRMVSDDYPVMNGESL